MQFLAERGIPLIEDLVYGDLYFGHGAPRAAKSYDRQGMVMLCSSFSKTLAPGFRLGWVAPGRYRNCIRLNCGYAWTPVIERALARVGDLAKAQLARPVARLRTRQGHSKS